MLVSGRVDADVVEGDGVGAVTAAPAGAAGEDTVVPCCCEVGGASPGGGTEKSISDMTFFEYSRLSEVMTAIGAGVMAAGVGVAGVDVTSFVARALFLFMMGGGCDMLGWLLLVPPPPRVGMVELVCCVCADEEFECW